MKKNDIKNQLVSIIVVNFNNSKYINQCIKSLQNQSYQNKEIIFVDNQSTDDSLDKIKLFKNINLIKNKRKYEYGSYNQLDCYYQGFLKSKGKIILFLDSDDFFKKNKIKNIVMKFKNNKNYKVLFDLPIYLIGKKKEYRKNKQKKFIISNWPRFSPQSCISIKKSFAKEVFEKVSIKKFPDIWFDFRIATYSFLKFNELIFINDYLTYYRIRKNSASSKFSKYNLNWWKRRNQAFDCYDYLCKKNNIVSLLSLDRILTRVINFVFNKL